LLLLLFKSHQDEIIAVKTQQYMRREREFPDKWGRPEPETSKNCLAILAHQSEEGEDAPPRLDGWTLVQLP